MITIGQDFSSTFAIKLIVLLLVACTCLMSKLNLKHLFNEVEIQIINRITHCNVESKTCPGKIGRQSTCSRFFASK